MLPAQVLPTIFGTKKGKIANNIKVIMVEQTALDRNSVSGLNQPRNTLKTKGFT